MVQLKNLKIVNIDLLEEFIKQIDFDVLKRLSQLQREDLPTNYFDYYNSVSSVYSAKIEGEQIDYDSFFKYKFLNVEYEPDYTKRSNDLYNAYQFILKNDLTKQNLLAAHNILAENLLPQNQKGVLRNNPMMVLGADDKIEYVACTEFKLEEETHKLFDDIDHLLKAELTPKEAFFFAAYLHLVFVKIHPFQDGNGRTGRLLEKWFLISKLGNDAVAVNLEKNYYLNRNAYYKNLRALGLEYDALDYTKAFDFLKMTIGSLN